jgi:mannose-6-phosphate isomerase-like protein (cupin superfamily)
MSMEAVLRAAVRAFTSEQHLIDVLADGADWLDLYDEEHRRLPGVRGRPGALGLTADGHSIGVDLIEMDAFSAFPLHVHRGDHILYGLEGNGTVVVDHVDYPLGMGTTVFIAAEQPHGVRGPETGRLRFLAFGVPHEHVSSPKRMTLVTEDGAEPGHDDALATKLPPSS